MSQEKKQPQCKSGAACEFHAQGKCKFGHPAPHAVPQKKHSLPKTLKPKLTRHAIMGMGRSLHAKKKMLDAALLLVKSPPAEKGWVMPSPDVKMAAPSPEYMKMLQDSYTGELKLARGALASVYGNKPVPFVIPIQSSFTCTTATGLLNATSDILFADSSECTTALAILFDEYRVSHGRYEFAIFTPTSSITVGTSSLTAVANASIGFDPADETKATATTDITALEYHKVWYPRTTVSSATSGSSATHYVGLYGKSTNDPFVFHWNYRDIAAFSGDGGAVGPGQWKATTGNTGTFPDGTLKTYYQTGETTAQITYAGTQYRTLLFRNRT